MKTASTHKWLLGLCFAAFAAVGCGEGGDDTPVLDAGTTECERDDQSVPENAAEVTFDQEIEGFVCPRGDRDWYSLTIPQDQSIARVQLQMDVALSPVEPNYTIWSIDGEGQPDEVVASPEFTSVGRQIDSVHCIGPGDYLMSVNDAGDDTQDLRHPYRLEVTTKADDDPQEPNNSTENASTLAANTPTTGSIACSGDQDWYKIDVPAGNLVRLTLTSDIAEYEPTLKLVDGEGTNLFFETNLSGRVSETDIDRFVIVPSGGEYFVVVSDDDARDSDPDVPYELEVQFVQDNDPNEPNNSATEATNLASSAVGCGANWSQWYESTGTIGAPGDDDWFRLPLTGCGNNAVIEARMEFQNGGSIQEQWAFNADVQASLTMVREVPSTSCDTDTECRSLAIPCSSSIDCAGYLESCLPDGLCAGATACLEGQVCGANQVQRNYTCPPRLPECQASSGEAPPPNEAVISAPILSGGSVYLRASDFQANAAAPDTNYTIRARVRVDPDDNEPTNVFTNTLSQDLPVDAHAAQAKQLTVRDCTAGDCCASGVGTTGAISYENDLDWYYYNHPCPGQDCLLRFNFQTESGPVDIVMNVYQSGAPWYTVLSSEELPAQSAKNGSVGGTAASDQCFYAYQGHEGSPFQYGVVVRDLREFLSDGRTVDPSTRDWDAEQNYTICIEKVANGCQTPCELADDDTCTVP
jgi:hypothetical protein